MGHFDNHAHTYYSNLRLLDCINRPKDLINKAIELGLSGIAITDHESVASWIEVNKFAKELRETNPDFTIALGDEIYLTDSRDMGQRMLSERKASVKCLLPHGLTHILTVVWNVYLLPSLSYNPSCKTTKVMSLAPPHVSAESLVPLSLTSMELKRLVTNAWSIISKSRLFSSLPFA